MRGLPKGRRGALACLLLAAVLAPGAWAAPAVVLRVYGYASDAPVKDLVSELRGLGPGYDVLFQDLAVGDNGERFARLLTVINTEANIPFLPDSVERRVAPPYIHFHNQNRYYAAYEDSLTGVFRGDALVAVVMGGKWFGDGFWERLLAELEGAEGLRVFVPSGTYQVADQQIQAEIAELFRGGDR
jgi:hypothetical protein